MGFLTHIASRTATAGTIIFWWMAGIGLGSLAGVLEPPSKVAGTYFLVGIGAALGMSVGFYAAWGRSKLARVLAIPGYLIDLVVMGA
jgi:hypothetical protein